MTISERFFFRCAEASNRPRTEYVPTKAATHFDRTPSPSHMSNNQDLADMSGYSLSPAQPAYQSSKGQLLSYHKNPVKTLWKAFLLTLVVVLL